MSDALRARRKQCHRAGLGAAICNGCKKGRKKGRLWEDMKEVRERALWLDVWKGSQGKGNSKGIAGERL